MDALKGRYVKTQRRSIDCYVVYICDVICDAPFVSHQAPDHQGHLDRQGCWDRAVHCRAGPGGDGREGERAGESSTCSHFST